MHRFTPLSAGLGFAGLLLSSTGAQAQTASPPPAPASPPPAPAAAPASGDQTTVQGVVVTAGDQPVKSSIDRRSYSIEGDLQATTGSISDALKSIPSVEVDIDGNVKLRGDTSVTILIDGKPSALMKGQGRADALQTLPAGQFARVEVLTNPGAQYSPDGTGGVINLVTKKSLGTGTSGSIRANGGTNGRANVGVNWAYNTSKLALSANAGLWRFSNKFESTDDRTLTGTGGIFSTHMENEARAEGLGGTVRLGADYDIDASNRLSAEFSAFGHAPEFNVDLVSERFDGAGTSLSKIRRKGSNTGDMGSLSGSLSWRREFEGEDHNLTLELSSSRWTGDNDSGFLTTYLAPPTPDVFELTDTRNVNRDSVLKGDYNRPMPGDARLKAGFELARNTSDSDMVFESGPAPGSTTINLLRSHRLIFEETVLSGYLTWEQPIGDFTILAGLRFESATDDLNLLTTGLKTSHDYDQVYPSLHLDYRLSAAARLKASYALRIRRPDAGELDPWLVYIDAWNYRQGNPNLEPSETRSWEVSYEYRQKATYYLATGFWRETSNGVTDVLVDLGGGVLLTTKANLAERRSGGLEFVANSRLNPKLSFNVTGTAMWTEIDATALGFTDGRSAWSLNGRASLDWQLTPNDLFQFNATANGKTITPQGEIDPTWSLNLGYRHKLDDRWFLTVTANDIFDTMEMRTVTDSPTVSGSSVRRSSSRGLSIGLRYRFGAGKPQRDPGFDYSGGPGGGGGPN